MVSINIKLVCIKLGIGHACTVLTTLIYIGMCIWPL